MRIAVDARELCGRPTGVGRYLRELLTEWTDDDQAGRHQWTLFAHVRPQVPSPWNDAVHILPGDGGTAWEQWTLARRLATLRPEVLFAPGYTAPVTGSTPTVLTIHDVSFFAHPEWFTFREGARRRWLTARAARRASLVLTDSAFSAREISRFIGIESTRVRTIPLGIRPPEALRDRGRRPTVLYVGSVFERRRVDRLIAAFDSVADHVPDARLEIVGENRTRRPQLDLEALRAAARNGDRISIRSYVDEQTLNELYGSASVFAFLSEYEGFGLPPLEALAAGVPPVVLDTTIARETCGGAARYVPADDDGHSLIRALVECLTSDPARRLILDEAPGVLARYQWARTAALTLSAIEEGAGV